jgi:hypothetical protein
LVIELEQKETKIIWVEKTSLLVFFILKGYKITSKQSQKQIINIYLFLYHQPRAFFYFSHETLIKFNQSDNPLINLQLFDIRIQFLEFNFCS